MIGDIEFLEAGTYNNDVLAVLTGAAATFDLDQFAEDAKCRLLVMHVAVCVQCCLDLAVNRVKIYFLLLTAVVTLVYETDAGINAICSCLPHVDTVILQRVKYQLDVPAVVEYPIERHN